MRVTRATSRAAGCIIDFTRATRARKEDIMAAEHTGRTAVDPEITIAPNPRRVVVKLGGRVIADSRRALVMRARDAAPSLYIPREDVAMSSLTLTSHHTRCPYKGDASYWTIRSGDRVSENAVWSYETPFASMAQIKGYLSFYPDRVDSIEELPV
jgi:uncharacterized protein (DUF427 family)